MDPLDPASVDGFDASKKGGSLNVLAQHLELKLLRLAAEGLVCWRSSFAVVTKALTVGTGIESLGAPLAAGN